MTLLLASYAITFAIQNGKVAWLTDHLQTFAFFRNMFACVLCTGTEVGLFLHLFTQPPSDLFTPHGAFSHTIHSALFGLAAGAFCLVTEVVLDALITHTDHGGDN